MCIVNPHSANGSTGREWPVIARELKMEGLKFDYRLTTRPGEAVELTRQVLAQGFSLIVSVGGDGTVHETVNGFFQNGELINPQAVLGIIPRGTGSDLARTLNLPRDPKSAAVLLKSPGQRVIDLGRVRFIDHSGQAAERYFVNLSDVGLGGETCRRVNNRSKVLGGFLSFLWGSLVTLLVYRNQCLVVTVEDQEVYQGKAVIAAVGNGQYFGGGMRIAPRAVMDDGVLDLVIAKNLSRPDLLANLYRVYRGTHLTHPKISWHRGKEIAVTVPGKGMAVRDRSADDTFSISGLPLIEVDGEQLGYAPACFSVLPAALAVKANS